MEKTLFNLIKILDTHLYQEHVKLYPSLFSLEKGVKQGRKKRQI
jgi:hypothetical protein